MGYAGYSAFLLFMRKSRDPVAQQDNRSEMGVVAALLSVSVAVCAASMIRCIRFAGFLIFTICMHVDYCIDSSWQFTRL